MSPWGCWLLLARLRVTKNNTHCFFNTQVHARIPVFYRAQHTRVSKCACASTGACVLLFPMLAIWCGGSLVRSGSTFAHLCGAFALLIKPARTLPLHHNWLAASCKRPTQTITAETVKKKHCPVLWTQKFCRAANSHTGLHISD